MHLEMLVEMAHPRMGKVRVVGSGIRMSETPTQITLPSPTAGENTEHILGELGFGEESVANLRKRGVI